MGGMHGEVVSAQQSLRPGGRREITAWLSLALIALMWSLPFLQPVHHYPLPAFYSEWLAFVLGLAAMCLLAGKRAWAHGEFPAIACAPLALATLILLQAAFGKVPYSGQAITAALYLIWFAGLITLGNALKERVGLAAVAESLACCLVAAGVVAAGIGALQYYSLQQAYPNVVVASDRIAYGNLAQPNHYADYLCLAIASAAYLYASGRLRGGVAALVTGILLFGVGASASRSAWAYLLAFVVLAMWFERRSPAESSRRLVTYTEWLVIGFALDQWVMTLSLFSNGNSMTATQRIVSEGGNARLEYLRVVWQMFSDTPLIGAGWGQFAWHDFEFRSQIGGTEGTVTHNAHNFLTHSLAETGLSGTAIIGTAVVLWLAAVWKNCRCLQACWTIMIIAVLGIHSMLEYPLWYAYFLGVLAVAVGLSAARMCRLSVAKIAPATSLLIIVIGALNAAFLASDYWELSHLTAWKPADPSAKAVRLEALSDRDVLLRPYAQFMMANDMPVDGRFLSEKLAANEQVLRFFPAPMVVYRHAALLALAGRGDEAATWLARARSAYPGALPNAVGALGPLAAAYPAQIAPLLELASAKTPPAVPAQ